MTCSRNVILGSGSEMCSVNKSAFEGVAHPLLLQSRDSYTRHVIMLRHWLPY